MGFMDKLKKMFGSTKSKAAPMAEKAKDMAGDAVEKVKDIAEDIKDKFDGDDAADAAKKGTEEGGEALNST